MVYVFENWLQAKESNIIQHMLYRKTNHFVKSIFYCQLYKTYQIKFDSFAERGEIKFILIANYSSQLEWSEAMA